MINTGLSEYDLANLYSPQNNQLLIEGKAIFEQQVDVAVGLFYNQLMASPESSQFLSTTLVQEKLKTELKKWILLVLSPKTEAEIPWVIQRQQHVGEVHARIDIPMRLVDSAMLIIKHRFFEAIMDSELSTKKQAALIICVDQILTESLNVIDSAYLKGLVETQTIAQEYRSRFTAQDVALEIERVKASLYDWFTGYLTQLSIGEIKDANAQSAEFALWIKHKLPLVCINDEIKNKIQGKLNKLIAECALVSEQTLKQQVPLLKQRVSEVHFLLTEMADSNIDKESKEDALTRLIERRFMVPILQKENHLALQLKSKFSIMMIDIDDFKQVNDTYGHVTGDIVLQHVAYVIKKGIRVSDYAFRYGGEEILVLLPESLLEDSVRVAEKIRKKIKDTVIKLESGEDLMITASFGVAEFFNHPDYMPLIQLADQKLYQAKSTGKDKVCF